MFILKVYIYSRQNYKKYSKYMTFFSIFAPPN